MNIRDVVFTMWVGSVWCLAGTDIAVGIAVASVPACAGIASVRPTMDAEYEVVEDDVEADQ